MADQYMGEIRAVSFNFAPRGWALCNGQIMAIQQNQAMFALLGTQFGGDGVRTFGLPNLQGRTPTAAASPAEIGLINGTESVVMTQTQLPPHTHLVLASTATATDFDPTGKDWAPVVDSTSSPNLAFTETTPNAFMAPTALTAAGGGQPIPILQPYTVVNYIISLTGIFPSRG